MNDEHRCDFPDPRPRQEGMRWVCPVCHRKYRLEKEPQPVHGATPGGQPPLAETRGEWLEDYV